MAYEWSGQCRVIPVRTGLRDGMSINRPGIVGLGRAILAGLVLLLAPRLAPAVPVNGAGQAVDIAIPAGFEPVTNPPGSTSDLLQSFVLGDAQDTEPGITLSIRTMAKHPQALRTADDWLQSLPTDMEFAGVDTNRQAQGRRFDMAYGRGSDGDAPRVIRMLRIPLRSRSLLLTMESSTSRATQVNTMMDMIVTSLGTNQAVVPPEPQPSGGDIPWLKTVIYLAITAAILLVGAKTATLMPGRR